MNRNCPVIWIKNVNRHDEFDERKTCFILIWINYNCHGFYQRENKCEIEQIDWLFFFFFSIKRRSKFIWLKTDVVFPLKSTSVETKKCNYIIESMDVICLNNESNNTVENVTDNSTAPTIYELGPPLATISSTCIIIGTIFSLILIYRYLRQPNLRNYFTYIVRWKLFVWFFD